MGLMPPPFNSSPFLFLSPLCFYPLVCSISHLLALSIIPPPPFPYSHYLHSSTIRITHRATQRLDSSIAGAANYQFLSPYPCSISSPVAPFLSHPLPIALFKDKGYQRRKQKWARESDTSKRGEKEKEDKKREQKKRIEADGKNKTKLADSKPRKIARIKPLIKR